jgi:Ni,Fe-hydrogenase III small subunit
VHIFLGPTIDRDINPDETNIFLGICQRHHVDKGTHLPGCPPHAEVLLKGIFGLFPDVERPKYADEAEEIKLERMLNETLASL